MSEGVVSQLQDSDLIMQTASVQGLAKRLNRFVKKHGPAVETLLELAVNEGTPTTTTAWKARMAKSLNLVEVFLTRDWPELLGRRGSDGEL